MSNRAGYWKSNVSGDISYKSFVPSALPPNPPVKLDGDLLDLLIKTHKRLAFLEGMASRLSNRNLFIYMYVRREALLSSQIEGIRADFDDIFYPPADENANRNISDVINCIKAAEYAFQRLKEFPLCNRFIRAVHAVLMGNEHLREDAPGEFRRSQNWIGGYGSELKNARYIPPAPEDMEKAMSDLENYINDDGTYCNLDVLIQAALVHYQFETIHPFADGNGRTGRLLIMLFLLKKRILSNPLLYISSFFKVNRIEYYDRLTNVREHENYEQWIKFFLLAVYESADDAIQMIDNITVLHDKNIKLFDGIGRSYKTVMKVFRYLEENPIIEIQKIASELGISFYTVSESVNRLCEAGILKQTAGNRRNRTFTYESYLDILRSGTQLI